MTDQETLFRYRLTEAEETLADARTMLANGVSARSVINRAYYAMFYSVLALFIAQGVEHKTSKHSGIIAIFNKEFVHTGKLGKEYSRMLHRLFDARQESDYKDLVMVTTEDAVERLKMAEEFLAGVKAFITRTQSE